VSHSIPHDSIPFLQVADDFSNYQLSKLMKRSRISQKLADVRHVLKSNETAVIGLGEESKVHEVEARRIMSSDSAHYILVKGRELESSSQDDSLSQSSMEFPVIEELEPDTEERGELVYMCRCVYYFTADTPSCTFYSVALQWTGALQSSICINFFTCMVLYCCITASPKRQIPTLKLSYIRTQVIFTVLVVCFS